MRLNLLALIVVACLALVFGQDRVDLLDVADQGAVHADNGDRVARGHHYDPHYDPHHDPHHDPHYDYHHDRHYNPHHDTHHDHYGH